MDNPALIAPIMALAKAGGEKILEVYNRAESPEVTIKSDDSPRTEADCASHQVISGGLRALTPDIPILSEEAADIPYAERSGWDRYWLIDPLDGTKEFIHRTGEFCVIITLIENYTPVLGVVYVPLSGVTYYACAGCGAYKQVGDAQPEKITTADWRLGPITVAASRRHAADSISGIFNDKQEVVIITSGSALKFGLVAEGLADLYPRLGPTSEWDTAAGQCIVTEAGGMVVDLDLNPLKYNTKDSLLNPSFLVIGDPKRDWRSLLRLAQ